MSRLAVLTHLFPGVSPVTVWDIPLSVWPDYAESVDHWLRESKKG